MMSMPSTVAREDRLSSSGFDRDNASRAVRKLFPSVSETVINRLLEIATIIEVGSDAFVYRQGDSGDRIYLILHGAVQIYRREIDDNRVVFELAETGDMFGEGSTLLGEPRGCTAQCVNPARLLCLPKDAFGDIIRAEPGAALDLATIMAQKLAAAWRTIERNQYMRTEARVAEYLYALSARNAGARDLDIPVGKTVLAGILGMKPETLSRTLKKIRKIGIRTQNRHIHIDDIERLKAMIDTH